MCAFILCVQSGVDGLNPSILFGQQLKEIGGKDSFRDRHSDLGKQSEQSSEKKKGFTDWVNMIKPGNEEKDHWVRL